MQLLSDYLEGVYNEELIDTALPRNRDGEKVEKVIQFIVLFCFFVCFLFPLMFCFFLLYIFVVSKDKCSLRTCAEHLCTSTTLRVI